MKYMIKPLELCCLDFLIANLSAANVFSFLQFCNDYEIDKKLMEQCLEFLRTNTNKVLRDESFLTISHKFLTLLLEDDFLNVTESRLFKAVCLCFFSILWSYSSQLKRLSQLKRVNWTGSLPEIR